MRNFLKKFKEEDYLRIVLVGDSTTTQDWCHPNWVDWLNYTFHETGDWNRVWKRQIINAGRDGGDEQHFIKNFNNTVKANNPDLVICSLGLNQLIPEFDLDKAYEETDRLFGMIKGTNQSETDLAVWSPYAIPNSKFEKNLNEINKVYKELAPKHDAIFIDMYSEFLKYDLKKLFTFTNNENKEWNIKENEPDFLHCNIVGNQIIAEKIAKEVFEIELLDWEFGTMTLQNLDKYKI